jgi:hypothetical protein
VEAFVVGTETGAAIKLDKPRPSRLDFFESDLLLFVAVDSGILASRVEDVDIIEERTFGAMFHVELKSEHRSSVNDVHSLITTVSVDRVTCNSKAVTDLPRTMSRVIHLTHRHREMTY